MKQRISTHLVGMLTVALTVAALAGLRAHEPATPSATSSETQENGGQSIFRFDSFDSERFFSDTLALNEALESVSPNVALAVGLKVDADALPPDVIDALLDGQIDLDDPAVTVELLRLGSVVGLAADIDGNRIASLGITCALCHSTVDDSILPGVGSRLDGWAARDLDVGAILGLSPNLQALADLLGVDVPTVELVLASWGPGEFDAHLNLDGKGLRPDGGAASVLIPPAFGLAGVNLATYTGWGTVSYWNALVANLEMGGSGRFYDPRLADPVQFPIAAANGFDNVASRPDLITKKLGALHAYQLSLRAPKAPEGSFDEAAAQRGRRVFREAGCAECHVPPLFTEPGYNLHSGDEIGIDTFQSDRSPTGKYRTTPLRGLWTHLRGGFYHDGRFATLRDVIDHYDDHFELGLTPAEKSDLEQLLLSL